MVRRLTVLPALIILLILAGCGGKSSSSSSSPTSAASSSAGTSSTPAGSSAGGGKSLSVSETEFKISPSNPSVPSGAVRVTAHNSGTVLHALEIENAGPGGKDLRSADISPGSTATLVANLKPGKTYVFYCPIDGHRGLGMKGTITVKSSGSATVAPSRKTSTGSSGGSSSSSSSSSSY